MLLAAFPLANCWVLVLSNILSFSFYFGLVRKFIGKNHLLCRNSNIIALKTEAKNKIIPINKRQNNPHKSRSDPYKYIYVIDKTIPIYLNLSQTKQLPYILICQDCHRQNSPHISRYVIDKTIPICLDLSQPKQSPYI